MDKKTIILFNNFKQYITLVYRILAINQIPSNHQLIILQEDQIEERKPNITNLQKWIKQTNEEIIFINFGHYFTSSELQMLFEQINSVVIISFNDQDDCCLDLPYKIKNKRLRLNKLIKHQLKINTTKPITKTTNTELDKLEELEEYNEATTFPYSFVESIGDNDSSSDSSQSPSPTRLTRTLTRTKKMNSKFYVKLEYEREHFSSTKHQNFKNIVNLFIKDINFFQFANTISDLFNDLKVTFKNFCDNLIIDHGLDIILEGSYPLDLDNAIG